ncbi:MAG: ABC transporter permease subunit [Nitrososphaerota archaeon]|jgi:ABC-type Na+ efflux pump permease subunit|nr:ABC transporter permease subunit [Nitrososphaerota archaeon]MDG6927882.1 ABC transporter permease subunit [Nitrososphaerota archaeon]MDG6931027.1 ABC transporter permease subunit [Nitrososphaerota archaeon]MDG6932113.1 ABC transporter permease subunit [Nitrososphaerota archaeon]MDG6936668.1 ABC transporter permease subunit [Nitrososphaerota archaeon]
MNLQNAWTIARKDLKIYIKKSTIMYSTIALPLIVGVVFPLIINYARLRHSNLSAGVAVNLLNAFSIWFIIGALVIPTAIASYTLVGEKVQKSLEPLLATPVSDGDILLGKILSALIIPVAALYAGAVAYMVLMDSFTHSLLGYFYYPNWNIGVILLSVPLASLLSVEISVLISSRINDVRSAQQLGSLVVIPFFGIYLLAEIGFFSLNTSNLAIIAGALGALDVIMFYIARATFQREEILTGWK